MFCYLSLKRCSFSHVWLFCSPTDYNLPGSSVHGISGKNTGVGCRFLLLGIFLIGVESESPASPALQADSLLLSHRGSPMGAWDCKLAISWVLVFLPDFKPNFRILTELHMQISSDRESQSNPSGREWIWDWMSSLEVSKVKTIVNTGLAVYIWNTGLLYLWLLFGSLNNNTSVMITILIFTLNCVHLTGKELKFR